MIIQTISGKTASCVLMALALLLLAGCGYNPEKPVYDTKANPDNYPAEALTLLDGIESGSLNSLMTIAAGFGELYTSHPDMLDNKDWHKVIARLGAKFKWLGDKCLAEGWQAYTGAGEYYQLASFARPDDPDIHKIATAFDPWLRAVADTALAPVAVLSDDTVSAAKVVALARRFVDAADSDRLFFDSYLKTVLRAKVDRLHLLDSAAMAGLTPADRVGAADAGLTDAPITDKIARFERPAVDLAACKVERLDTGRVKIMLYVVPREQVTKQLSAAMRVLKFPEGAPDPDSAGDYAYPQSVLSPNQPVGFWPMDKVTRVVDTFLCREPAIAVAVSMYTMVGDQLEPLTIDGGGERQVFLRFDIPNPGLVRDESTNQQ